MIRRLALAMLTLTALGAAVLVGPTGAVAAQELTGVALGPDGGALAGFPIVLHRVGGGGGAFVATDTTTPEGGFRFELPSADTAIYFVAVRYQDRMYIGPAVPAGGEPVSGYVLSVEPGSEAGAVASALGGRGPAAPPARTTGAAGATAARTGSSDAGALVLLALLTLAGVSAFLVAAPRYRHRRTRNALIELARVENALADPAPSDDTSRLQSIRDRLRKQLAPRS